MPLCASIQLSLHFSLLLHSYLYICRLILGRKSVDGTQLYIYTTARNATGTKSDEFDKEDTGDDASSCAPLTKRTTRDASRQDKPGATTNGIIAVPRVFVNTFRFIFFSRVFPLSTYPEKFSPFVPPRLASLHSFYE